MRTYYANAGLPKTPRNAPTFYAVRGTDGDVWIVHKPTNLAHARHQYPFLDACNVASWLTERAAGYPVTAALEHLYGSHADAAIINARARNTFERAAGRRRSKRGPTARHK